MRSDNVMPVGIYEKALAPELGWDERLEVAARAGYDYVEISIDESDERLARLKWTAGERAALRRAIDQAGIPVLTMCLSGHRRFPLGSASLQVRHRALDIFRRAVDLAADIGVRIVQVMGYDVFYEPHDAGTDGRFLDGLRAGTRWAGEAGVMLGLENVDIDYANSVRKGMRFVEALCSPWFQLYPDMGNLAAADLRPADELRLAQGHIVALHVKDTQPQVFRGVPFGQGIVPFDETFRTLAEIGFWGPLTVEMWWGMDTSGDPLAAVVAARERVARLSLATWPEGRASIGGE